MSGLIVTVISFVDLQHDLSCLGIVCEGRSGGARDAEGHRHTEHDGAGEQIGRDSKGRCAMVGNQFAPPRDVCPVSTGFPRMQEPVKPRFSLSKRGIILVVTLSPHQIRPPVVAPRSRLREPLYFRDQFGRDDRILLAVDGPEL